MENRYALRSGPQENLLELNIQVHVVCLFRKWKAEYE